MTTGYANLNYLFRLHIPDDEILNHLCIANITERDYVLNRFSCLPCNSTSNVTGVNFIPFHDGMNNTTPAVKFISLMNILPTAVGLIPTTLKNNILFALRTNNNSSYEVRFTDLKPSSVLISADDMTLFTKESKSRMSSESGTLGKGGNNMNLFYGRIVFDLHSAKVKFIKDLYDPDIEGASIQLTTVKY